MSPEKREETYERLLQALLDMKNEIQTRIRPLEDQIVQANVEYLKEVFEQQNNRLGDCLDSLDQKILDCRMHIEDYKRIYTDLDALNDRLSRLGAESLPISISLPSTDIGDVIRQRIEDLKLQGRIR